MLNTLYRTMVKEYLFSVTEIPSEPENVTVKGYRDQPSKAPYSLTVQWDTPANIDKFDLEYYKIQVLPFRVGESYVLNVTSPKLEYPFGLIMNSTSLTQHGLNNLTVSAVSKCSQQGPAASSLILYDEDNIMLSASPDYSSPSTTTTVTDYITNGMACMHVVTIDQIIALLLLLPIIKFVTDSRTLQATLDKGM